MRCIKANSEDNNSDEESILPDWVEIEWTWRKFTDDRKQKKGWRKCFFRPKDSLVQTVEMSSRLRRSGRSTGGNGVNCNGVAARCDVLRGEYDCPVRKRSYHHQTPRLVAVAQYPALILVGRALNPSNRTRSPSTSSSSGNLDRSTRKLLELHYGTPLHAPTPSRPAASLTRNFVFVS